MGRLTVCRLASPMASKSTPPHNPYARSITRSALAHAGFQLWLLNILVGTLVGSLWLFRLPEGLSFWVRLYEPVALISSIAILGILPAIPLGLIHRFVQRPLWVGILQSLTGAVFLGLLYTDTVVYRLLRYHFNGAILNVAFTPGSGDAVYLGSEVWITATVAISVLTLLQFLFWRWRLRRIIEREGLGLKQTLLLRPYVLCLAVFLPLITIDKSLYAMASISGDRELLYASRPLPGPKPRLGYLIDALREGRQDIHGLLATASLGGESGQAFTYPKERPEIPADGHRPNILMVVLDSWRRDAFNEELTPLLAARAQKGRVFRDHKSGGNGTRFGLFTMLYGLHGSYWFRALENGTTPVLIDTLQEQDYDIRVLSAASMNFPEFLQTAWAGLDREQVVDQFLRADGKEVSRRSDVKDRLVADAFAEWMEEREQNHDTRPYFCFVLLDSPHQPYFNPGGPFKPALKDGLKYIDLGSTTEEPALSVMREQVSNTYKNCVLYADGVADSILAEAERADASRKGPGTVVMVTGDHGEEFYENGYWGHTSNYTPEQINVPLILYGPGIEPGQEMRPTSHLDVSGSLLELLGADRTQRGGYTQGESLFAPVPQNRARVVAGFADVGLITEEGIFMLPAQAGEDEPWVFDDHWQPMPEMDARFTREQERLIDLVQECQEFLEPLP
ncbi:MAG TPA: sulfatase-like hydrolase/transferase [Planctomycetota bacterium]|nr:sulfatase-like hydrolase/transferase [Planctomycetota bacterium]